MLGKKQKMRIVNRIYRHKIEIWDVRNTEENDYGEDIQVPKRIMQLWADVEPTRGREVLEANRLESEMTYRIITRYRKELNPSMIIVWPLKDIQMNITAITDISGKEEHIEITAIERVEKYDF